METSPVFFAFLQDIFVDEKHLERQFGRNKTLEQSSNIAALISW